jgi:hypothetical protein
MTTPHLKERGVGGIEGRGVERPVADRFPPAARGEASPVARPEAVDGQPRRYPRGQALVPLWPHVHVLMAHLGGKDGVVVKGDSFLSRGGLLLFLVSLIP